MRGGKADQYKIFAKAVLLSFALGTGLMVFITWMKTAQQ